MPKEVNNFIGRRGAAGRSVGGISFAAATRDKPQLNKLEATLLRRFGSVLSVCSTI